MEKMRAKLLRYGISVAVGVILSLLIMILKGIFTETDSVQIFNILSDSFLVPGVLLAGVGLLVFASNGGIFDMLAYGILLIGYKFMRDVTKRKYRTYYDYKESRKGKKRDMAFLLIVGIIFIVISAVMLIPYYILQ